VLSLALGGSFSLAAHTQRRMAQIPACMAMTEEDVKMMLACQVHLGTVNVDAAMQYYVYKRRLDGVHLIDLSKTWEKLMLAARIIAGIENPQDIVVVSARPYGQRAILKLAKYLHIQAIAGRYTPGTFTNQIQKKFLEPRLLIATDPRTDHQAIVESGYCNLPVISLCGTDNALDFVDLAIPCNNKGRTSIGLMYWLLTREVLRIKGQLDRKDKWDVMPDLYFFRDVDEKAKAKATAAAAATTVGAPGEAPKAGGEWPTTSETAPEAWPEHTVEGEEWGAEGATAAATAPQTAPWETAAPAPGTTWETPVAVPAPTTAVAAEPTAETK